jgi:hypothetical protein
LKHEFEGELLVSPQWTEITGHSNNCERPQSFRIKKEVTDCIVAADLELCNAMFALMSVSPAQLLRSA